MDRTADVVVVGGGIRGVGIAYYLARAGVCVTLVEKGFLGSGASSANAGLVNVSQKTPGRYTAFSCLRLQRAGLGADVMGTGARPRGSEGGGHVHVVYAPDAVTFAGIGVRRVHLTNFSLFFAVLVCLACLVVAVLVLTRGDDEHA